MLEQLIETISEMISGLLGDNVFDYWLGVTFAILAGVIANVGNILMKMVVNEKTEEEKFMRSLIKNPKWLSGLILQMGVSSIFFISAQFMIGPTLIPGLMASGLIVLAIGSVKIVGEKLEAPEFIGIVLMIFATAFIGLSNMEINIESQDFNSISLIIRITLFTISLFILSGIFEMLQRRNISKGILLAVISGIMLALINFWIGPCMGLISSIFGLTATLVEWIIFVVSAILLISANFIAIPKIQESFRVAQASIMIPIQQVPVQIAPPFYFLVVFLLPIPNILSVIFITIGIALTIVSSFLLARRQAELEEIK